MTAWTRESWARHKLERLADEMRATPEGGRNSALFSVTARVAPYVLDGALSEEEARRSLTDAAVTAGLSAGEAHGVVSRAIRKEGAAWYPDGTGESGGPAPARHPPPSPRPRPAVVPSPSPSRAHDDRYDPAHPRSIFDLSRGYWLKMHECLAELEYMVCENWRETEGTPYSEDWRSFLKQRLADPAAPPRGTPPPPTALDKEKKDTPMWCLGDWPGRTRKAGSKMKSCQLMGVDYDDGTTEAQLKEMWGRWTHAAHTTANHLRDKAGGGERWRVYVPLARRVSVLELDRLQKWLLHPRNAVGSPDRDASASPTRGYGAPVRWDANYRWYDLVGVVFDPDEAMAWLEHWESLDAAERWDAEQAPGGVDPLAGLHVRDAVARLLENQSGEHGAGPFWPLPGGKVDLPEDWKTIEWKPEDVLPDPKAVPPSWEGLWRHIGPWRPDRLAILVGGTGRGKSAMALQAAEAAARHEGHPVLYVSAEMGTDELVARLVALRAALSLDAVNRTGGPGLAWTAIAAGAVPLDALKPAGDALAKDCPALYLWAPEGRGRTIDAIRDVAYALAAKHGRPPMIVLDYLQRLTPGGDGESGRREAVIEMSGALRELSRPNRQKGWPGAAVLALSSIARAHYDKVASTEALQHAQYGGKNRENPKKTDPPQEIVGLGKEAGEIEFDAPVVMVMTTDRAEHGQPRDVTCYVAVPKNRGGRAGVHAWMRFYPACGIFRSSAGRETPEAPLPDGPRFAQIPRRGERSGRGR